MWIVSNNNDLLINVFTSIQECRATCFLCFAKYNPSEPRTTSLLSNNQKDLFIYLGICLVVNKCCQLWTTHSMHIIVPTANRQLVLEYRESIFVLSLSFAHSGVRLSVTVFISSILYSEAWVRFTIFRQSDSTGNKIHACYSREKPKFQWYYSRVVNT